MGMGRDEEAARELMLTCLVLAGVMGVVALVIGTIWPGGLRQVMLVVGLAGVIVSVGGVLIMLARTAHSRGADYASRSAQRRNAS